ncbi:putative MFS family arabinose efflux permease [Motilibacter peucedani]|uniref:Putative MFS family arabinose efflux permease n=1 Tax=Motilibacter peucedani TaxID=598650 RepID=A0A420XK84_9ACTN|nr:MFS transporter [Motilibacter peucedani]RKS68551.1 putative MFS family arabinose efflux permease [Motilibacter peucedani]
MDPRLKPLLWGSAVSAVGDGLWFTVSVVFFVHERHFSASAVGVAMTLAGLVGMLTAIPLGGLADSRSPRGVLVGLTLVRAAAMAAYLLPAGVWAFGATTVVFVSLKNGISAIRVALVAGVVPGGEARVAVLARARVAQHVGYAVGAAIGSAVLTLDRAGLYTATVLLNTATFLVLAAFSARLPAGAAASRPGSALGAYAVLRDLPFCAVCAVTAVLSLCWAMLSTGLPLWVSGSTRLPLALSGAVVVVSSVGIAALQVPAGRLVRTPRAAARTAAGAGFVLALSCLVLATTSGGRGPLAAAAVLLAGVLHLAGELGYVAASWTLTTSLMREEAKGAYQGAAESATATVQVLGPGLFALAVGGAGAGGWLAVGAVFAAAGAGVPVTARWAQRNRGVGQRPLRQVGCPESTPERGTTHVGDERAGAEVGRPAP